jgi:hypothetical protein
MATGEGTLWLSSVVPLLIYIGSSYIFIYNIYCAAWVIAAEAGREGGGGMGWGYFMGVDCFVGVSLYVPHIKHVKNNG